MLKKILISLTCCLASSVFADNSCPKPEVITLKSNVPSEDRTFAFYFGGNFFSYKDKPMLWVGNSITFSYAPHKKEIRILNLSQDEKRNEIDNALTLTQYNLPERIVNKNLIIPAEFISCKSHGVKAFQLPNGALILIEKTTGNASIVTPTLFVFKDPKRGGVAFINFYGFTQEEVIEIITTASTPS